jgi:hypothetical protein
MSLPARVMSLSIVAVLLLGPSDAGAQALTLELENGLVTLNAKGVSVLQILERWATIGSVTLINGDAVAATPVTLQLSGVPERAALETLLRDVSGYILGRRQQGAGAVTEFDRIMILRTSVASRVPSTLALAPLPAFGSADETSASGAVIVAPPDVSVAVIPPRPSPSALTSEFQSPQRVRPPEQMRPEPIKYLDQLDEDGNRMRAPSISKHDPADQPAPDAPGQGSRHAVPANPFGITTGSSRPGTISPVPAQPQP